MALLSFEIFDTIVQASMNVVGRPPVVGLKERRRGKEEQVRPRVQGHEAKLLLFVMVDILDADACAAHTGGTERKRM
jgi:hypothetical protein